MMMKAAVWTAINQINVQEIPIPHISDNEVLIKVKSAGVCMTDLHVYTGAFSYGNPPHVLGHEIAGEIVRLGSAVSGWQLGERVVVETSIGCGVCRFCQSGQRHLCRTMTEIGFPPNQGGYAQYMSAPATNLIALPDYISYNEGGILESAVCPIGALYRLGIQLADTVVVFGVGPAGISFIQGAKAMGAGKIIAVARNDFHLNRALTFGADSIINSVKQDAVTAIMEETNHLGANIVIDAAGVPNTIEATSLSAARGGKIILYGLPNDNAVLRYPVKDIIMKQLSIHGAVGNPLVWEPLLTMVGNGSFNLRDMVTHTFSLEHIEEAFQTLTNKSKNTLKIVIHPWEES